MSVKVEIIGADVLKGSLMEAATLKHVKEAVRYYTIQLDQSAKRKAVFRGHYEWVKGKGKVWTKPTGNLRRMIAFKIEPSGLEGVVKSAANYAGYVEGGTRYMDAQPYLRPALNEIYPKFLEQLKRFDV